MDPVQNELLSWTLSKKDSPIPYMKTQECEIELAETERERKLPPAPFYHTNTKTGKPTQEMDATRAILLTLAREGKPMTVHAISKVMDMPRTNVGRYCRQLKKLGVVKAEELRQKSQSQSYWPYSLTYEGRVVALSIDLTMEHGAGLDRKALTKECIEQMPFATPFHKFAQSTYLAFLERGREDIVQNWLKGISEAVFRDGVSDVFVGAWMAASGFDIGDKVVLGVIDEAFSKLSRKEAVATKFYLKYALQAGVIEDLIRHPRGEIGEEFFKEAAKKEDLDSYYIPFTCPRCNYFDPRKAVTVREMLACYITNRTPVCSNCRMWSKIDVVEDEKKRPKAERTRRGLRLEVKQPNAK
jgi:DNA-binding Lrp family transcriptional regulator